jgi:dihydroflavonol-4-reductase
MVNRNMQKVLVTGANGFLGSNLTRELFRLGYEVRAFVRPGAVLQGIADIPCEIFYGHIHLQDEVCEAIAGCSIVIHTAAVTDQYGISYEEYESVNFVGTRNVAEACLRYDVKKLIFVSTSNTIGPGDLHEPGIELNGFNLFKANSAYINTKFMAQQYLLEQVERKLLPCIIVNPTFMVGPNDIKPSSGKLMLYAMKQYLLFYPPGGKNFIFIGDVCRGIINAIDHGRPGNCYLLAGHNMSYKDYFKLVNKIAGKRKIMIGVPASFVKLAALTLSFIGKLTSIPVKFNFAMAYLSCLEVYYSGKKAERQLKIQYTSMEEAVSSSLRWFKENNYC